MSEQKEDLKGRILWIKNNYFQHWNDYESSNYL